MNQGDLDEWFNNLPHPAKAWLANNSVIAEVPPGIADLLDNAAPDGKGVTTRSRWGGVGEYHCYLKPEVRDFVSGRKIDD